MMRKEKEAIHIGINYSEALSAKKDVLLCETDLLEIIKKMRKFSELRKREFVLKHRIRKRLINLDTAAKELDKELPKTDLEEKGEEEIIEERQRVGKNDLEKIEVKRKESIRKEKNRKIEEELEDIKQKLSRLS